MDKQTGKGRYLQSRGKHRKGTIYRQVAALKKVLKIDPAAFSLKTFFKLYMALFVQNILGSEHLFQRKQIYV